MLLELLRMSPIGATPLGKKQSLKFLLHQIKNNDCYSFKISLLLIPSLRNGTTK